MLGSNGYVSSELEVKGEKMESNKRVAYTRLATTPRSSSATALPFTFPNLLHLHDEPAAVAVDAFTVVGVPSPVQSMR